MFATKYKPTVQKSLFHKDIINHIRKWIKMLGSNSEHNICLKRILFLHGPIGCAKSVTVECLFKAYNLINIDIDNLSSNEKTNDILNAMVDFNSLTLENIFTKKRNKQNIVFIDNIELCEKGLDTFVDSIHSRYNIPIILVCNNLKYTNVYCNNNKGCTLIEFKKPSLLELNKMLSDINESEKLNLTKENNKKLIEKSQYDIRQLFFLVEQWYLSKNIQFDNFIKAVDMKNEDQDLIQKMSYLLDYNKTFDFNKSFEISISEPQVLSNSIYQNYNFINAEKKSDNDLLLSRYSDMLYSMSESTIFHNQIYENQCWDLYNEYTVFSTIIPSYYFKLNKDILKKDDFKHISIVSFKDFSYNFINSYSEVKNICKTNLYSKKLNENTNNTNIINCICDIKSCFSIVQILINCIDKLNEYFDKNKKGKNTTKKEKIDLCNSILDDYKKYFDKLICFIYEYKLFEIDVDSLDFKIYKNEDLLKEDLVREHCSSKVDLRVLKRFLNIFTLDDSHKNFKSHIEISLQYKIFIIILDYLEKQSTENKFKIHETTQTMTTDLSEIWNF
jgi:DNA polymerase III delta prime subunit